MRSAIVGVFFRDQDETRREFAAALAEVTHRDPRAVEGALFVAEVAALCAREYEKRPLAALMRQALEVVRNTQLNEAIGRGIELAEQGRTTEEAARECGTTGFVVHTAAFAGFCFARFGDAPMQAMGQAIAAGGDTDSIAAIVGGWCGARWGMQRLPADLISRIHDGPFGPSHLKRLAACLDERSEGKAQTVPRYSRTVALARNLALYPVILAHGLRRLISF